MQEEVRVVAAAQIHEILRMVGPEKSQASLARPMLRLMDDDSPVVLQHLMDHLAVIMETFQGAEGSSLGVQFRDLVRAIARAEGKFGFRWRMTLALTSNMPVFARLVPGDLLVEAFVPIAFKTLTSGAAATKDSAALGLCCMLRQLPKEKQRTEVRRTSQTSSPDV